MALRSDWSAANCPIARGLDILGDPWVLLILREVLSGVCRFDELRAVLGVADNILAGRLKRMVDTGLLEKHPYTEGVHPRSEYLPTRAAAETLPILQTIAKWAEHHASSAHDNGLDIICQACGARSTTGETCSTCGVQFETSNVTWVRPTRARVDLIKVN